MSISTQRSTTPARAPETDVTLPHGETITVGNVRRRVERGFHGSRTPHAVVTAIVTIYREGEPVDAFEAMHEQGGVWLTRRPGATSYSGKAYRNPDPVAIALTRITRRVLRSRHPAGNPQAGRSPRPVGPRSGTEHRRAKTPNHHG